MATVLIAENDPRTLDLLPRILSDHLPQVSIDLCNSAEELCHKHSVSSCDTMVVSPILLQEYRFLKPKWTRQLVTPLLVTASAMDRAAASQCLAKDAFDLIVKPLVTKEAVQTVKLALWQNKLLTLLAARDQATAIFRQHMATCPLDWRTGEQFVREREAFERTLQALQSSLRLLLNADDDRSLVDIAASVETLTRQRALDRLLTLCPDGMNH